MSQPVSRRLRPYLFFGFNRIATRNARTFVNAPCLLHQEQKGREVTHDYEKRVAQLEGHKPLAECWPRLPLQGNRSAVESVKALCEELVPGETSISDPPTTVAGTVHKSSIQHRETDAFLQAESTPYAQRVPNFSFWTFVAAMPQSKASVSCPRSTHHHPNSNLPPRPSGKATGMP